LNIRTLTISDDEAKYGIKYKAQADYKVLGQKLKKDLVKVKNALPNLPSDQVKQFLTTHELLVDGIRLVEGDIQVIRFFKSNDDRFETNTDKDVLILLDTLVDEELLLEGLAREVINRVQRLRKKVGGIYWYDNK
jgi:isoleucyl-tRNA synthetase